MFEIPEDYTAFFHWVKERTEEFWGKNPSTTDEYFRCEPWAYGAKWIGMEEKAIESIEKKYSIKFTPEHRAFLRILHTIDRKQEIEYTETFDDDEEPKIETRPFFYNWLTDNDEIAEKLQWPFDTILQDIEGANRVWLKSWGDCPESVSEKKHVLLEWLHKAPPLIPLHAHRFIVSDTQLPDRPILSVCGTDIIVYGWDLRLYLLNELTQELGLQEKVYDEEDARYYFEPIAALNTIREISYTNARTKDIPYWKEMIMYWSSGYSSFGLEFPYKSDGSIQPIIKANSDNEFDNSSLPEQKIFIGKK